MSRRLLLGTSGRRRGVGAVAAGLTAAMVALSGPSVAQDETAPPPDGAPVTDEAAGLGAPPPSGEKLREAPAPPGSPAVAGVKPPEVEPVAPPGEPTPPKQTETEVGGQIVGGSPAPTGAYPFFVSVQTSGGSHFCGGSMVSANWVLTASHCVDGGTTPGSLRVVVGRTTLSNTTQGVVRNVDLIRLHPSWNASTFQNDAALLRLTENIPQNLRWSRLARAGDPFAPGNSLRVIGHGRTTEGGTGSDQLMQVDVPVQSDATMQQSSVYGSSFDPATMIGAGPLAGGQDSCQGDSGGPLFVNSGSQVPQVGVVSWGTGCARENKPGVYAEMPAAALTNFVNANVPRPGNDNFAGFSLSGQSGTSFGSNAGATSQAGEPAGGETGVWYSWTAPASGPVTFNTRDANWDTVLNVYTGSSLGGLTQVAFNDDYGSSLQSKLTFNASAGTTYRIRVRGFAAAWGSFGLQWAQNPPPNDDFANAAVMNGVTGTASGSNSHSTGEPGEPNHAGSPPDRTVWWRWTAPESGPATISLRNSTFDTTLGVYTGSAVGGLTQVAANDDHGGTVQSKANFTAVAGTTYRVAVDGFAAQTGSIALEWSVGRPANDDFATPQVLSGPTGTVTGTSARSTAEPGEPDHAGSPPDRGVWYRWTAPESGPATLNTRTSSFDTTLAVYTGSTLSGLTSVAANDDVPGGGSLQSKVSFNATAGTVYRIAVDGFAAQTGSIVLQWSVNPPANDDFANAQVLPGSSGDVPGTTVRSTGEPGSPPFHGGAAADNSVWYSWTPSVTRASEVRLTDLSSGLFPGIEVYTGNAVSALTSVAAGSTSARFNALAGTTYRIAVDANGGGVGSFRVGYRVATAPPAPQAVSATWQTLTSVEVSFTPPADDGGSAITGYQAQCTSPDGGVTRTSTGSASPRTVTNLSSGFTYNCRVRATNAVGNGPFSAFVPATTTVPGVPGNVSAAWLTTTSASVSFTAPTTNGGSAITTYVAQCTSPDGGTTRTNSGATSPRTVSNLTPGATYNCRVRAVNAVGTGPFSAFAPAVRSAPGAPQNVTAAWVSTTSASVSFAAPFTDGGSEVTGYQAQCTSTDGGTTRSRTGAVGPLQVNNLTPGATYTCRVRATNAIGTGPYSPFAPAVRTAPAAPTNVTATPVSATSASVSFTPPASNGGSDITSYQAQCTSTDGGTTRSGTGAAGPVTVTSLSTGKTYRCRVRATNAIGTGVYSAYSATFVVA